MERLGLCPPVEVADDATLAQVAEVMAAGGIGAVLVRGPAGLVGIVSERDIVGAVGSGADLATTRASDVMSESVVSLDAALRVAAAAAAMADLQVRHLPVTVDGSVVGMVSARDVLGPIGRCSAGLGAG